MTRPLRDASCSCDLRDERDRRTTFDGQWHVFADGVRFEDLRAALQAAWLAGDYDLARELARRYDFYNLICLCCASALIGFGPNPSGNDWRPYQLCVNCWTRDLRERSALKKPLPSPSKTR